MLADHHTVQQRHSCGVCQYVIWAGWLGAPGGCQGGGGCLVARYLAMDLERPWTYHCCLSPPQVQFAAFDVLLNTLSTCDRCELLQSMYRAEATQRGANTCVADSERPERSATCVDTCALRHARLSKAPDWCEKIASVRNT